jgi:ubiquinone/menaquinone biosynthesis C-methylase UbiE
MGYDTEYERILARSYDSVYRVIRDPSGDIEFYVGQARRVGGPVLELGCGTGRILLPTAETGIECVGLDASTEMLAVLAEKSPPANVELVEARIEKFELGEGRFRLITAPFRVLQHMLDVETQLTMLHNVRRHLAPGGVFVFDVFDPKLDRMALLEEPEVPGAAFVHDGHEMRRHERITRDLATQVMTVRFRLEGGPKELQGTSEIKMRWFYRFELEHLLVRAGFTNLEFLRNFRNEAWRPGQDIVVVASAS